MSRVQVENLDTKLNQKLINIFKEFAGDGFSYYGKEKFIYSTDFKHHVDNIKNMPVKADDLWLITFPRSGTTWNQEILWLLNNNMDFDKARTEFRNRYYWLDNTALVTKQYRNKIKHVDPYLSELIYEKAESGPSPRHIQTHLPLSLLPEELLDTAKVVYVARDPRDVAISYYHLARKFRYYGFNDEFDVFWNLFIDGHCPEQPIFEHVKLAWEKRDHRNLCFIFYEDLIKDLYGTIRKIEKFLGKNYTSEQITKLCDYVKFDNLKNNQSANIQIYNDSPIVNKDEAGFVRKGGSGGWRNVLTEKQKQQADEWLKKNLSDSDLKYPSIN